MRENLEMHEESMQSRVGCKLEGILRTQGSGVRGLEKVQGDKIFRVVAYGRACWSGSGLLLWSHLAVLLLKLGA